MSGKLSKNRKRPIPSSTFKTKRLKVPDCKSNEDVSEDDTSSDKMTMKKLVTLSQPTLRNDLKIKLHSLLSNWKPPLKNTHNENHKDCVTTDCTQESEMKLLKCDDTVSESKQLQTISPTNCNNLKFTQAEISLNNDNYNVNNNLEQKFLDQHEIDNDHESSTSLNQVSEPSTDETYATVDFKEQITKDILMHDTKVCEVIIKDKNFDAKSLEDSPNERVNKPYSKASTGFSTPEVTRTPPTPPTLKVSWLNGNEYNSPCNSIRNEAPEEPSNLNRESLNEPNTRNEENLLETWTNDELLTTTKELGLETLAEHTVNNSFQTERELDVNTLHSQLNTIEQNLSTTVTQRDLTQEVNPQREVTQELKNIDFTPFHPTSLVPKMPRLNWVRQLRDDKKQLQAIVREISQLNAMLTRAVRELWSERNPL